MTLIEYYRLSNYLQGLGSLLIFFLALVYSRSNSFREIRVIGIYGLVSFLFFLAQKSVSFIDATQYLNIIGDFFVLFETSILLFLYYFVVKNAIIRTTILTIGIIFLVFFTNYLFSDYKGLGSEIRSYRDVSMILFSVIYFGLLLRNPIEQRLFSHPMFWVNSSILFFFSCTFILSLSMSYIAEVLRDDFAIFWAFRNFLRFGFCIAICIGIWKARDLSKRAELT